MEFDIKDCLSEDLATRNRASQFFEMLESSDSRSIVVNFTQVQSISRSFADEYLKRKKASHLTIHERNVPNNVQKMFEIVKSPAEKKTVVDISRLKIGML
ncbi:MAG: hypothetical protein LLG16_01935 [Euryarchaeota archaeon]|nr:hypothetical protein [Euryarchaeota archaeon]